MCRRCCGRPRWRRFRRCVGSHLFMRGLVQQWKQTGCSDSEHLGLGMSRRNRVLKSRIWKKCDPRMFNMPKPWDTIAAHRIAYQLWGKDWLPGFEQIHHVCRNRACVNLAHLVRVEPKEHLRRYHRRLRIHRRRITLKFVPQYIQEYTARRFQEFEYVPATPPQPSYDAGYECEPPPDVRRRPNRFSPAFYSAFRGEVDHSSRAALARYRCRLESEAISPQRVMRSAPPGRLARMFGSGLSPQEQPVPIVVVSERAAGASDSCRATFAHTSP